MAPYLLYGFGIRACYLPENERERLIHRQDVFAWFFAADSDCPADDTGIFYLIQSNPFEFDDPERPDRAWADNLDNILTFKTNAEAKLSDRIDELGLSDYSVYIEFLCSVTEV